MQEVFQTITNAVKLSAGSERKSFQFISFKKLIVPKISKTFGELNGGISPFSEDPRATVPELETFSIITSTSKLSNSFLTRKGDLYSAMSKLKAKR